MKIHLSMAAVFAGFLLGASNSAPVLSAELETNPLNAPQKQRGVTLFDKLPPAETGVDFQHEWKPPAKWVEQISGSFTGCGVSIGDYDNDGRPDIYLTRTSDGGRLYRNLGGFKFADVTKEAGLSSPGVWGAGASWADVNNDGWLDLYLCAFDAPNRLFINVEGKKFEEKGAEYQVDFRGASIMLAFSDYDLDGDLDGYLVTNRMPPSAEILQGKFDLVQENGKQVIKPEKFQEYVGVLPKPDGSLKKIVTGQWDHLLIQHEGKFFDASKYAGIAGADYGLSATWWDYNSDGYPDLYVANDFYGPDKLYRNNRNGKFTDVIAEAMPHTPWFSMGADVADINNDGHLDFMASDMAGAGHYRDKMSMGNMTGIESDSWFLNWPAPAQYMRNAVYLNTGTSRFMEVAHMTGLSATDWTWSVKFGDLDNDGREDVFITNGMSRDWFNSDLRNIEEKIILEKGNKAANTWWRTQEPLALKNRAFRNEGDLKFEDVGASWGLGAEETVSYGAALGDLDGDGDLDVVVNNFEGPPGIYRNGSTNENRVTIRLVGTKASRFGIGAVLRAEFDEEPRLQMKTLTLSRGFMSSNEPLVHFGLGENRRIRKLTIEWPGGGVQTLENLAGGKHYKLTQPEDLPEKPAGDASATRLFRSATLMHGYSRTIKAVNDFDRQPLLPWKHSELGRGVAYADINGDGTEDLAVGGASSYSTLVYLGAKDGLALADANSNTRWSSVETFSKDQASEDMAPLFFDADGDGDQDLLVVSGGVACESGDARLRDRIYLNDGKGVFAKAPASMLPDLRDSGSVACAADFDRDGDLDLFIGGRIVPGRYPESPASRLLRNEDGKKFVDVSQVLFSGMVTSALWSDVDGDGWIDLLVTHEWGPVHLHRNHKGTLKPAVAISASGWWNSIAGGDFDNDGDIDYVVGNFGLNTKYHASVERPVTIYHGDLDGSGKKRIVEAIWEEGKLFPVRGLSCSSNAMPSIKIRLPKFHDFASATLDKIYDPDRLEKAAKFEVSELASGVLFNDGKGKFTFRALPRVSQVAPIFGIGVLDLDTDGNLDLVVAQNFHDPQPETGRMAGGVSLVLLGDGKGKMSPVWPDESGLVIAGEARTLALADLNRNGLLDVAIGVKGRSIFGFENIAGDPERTLVVPLRGSGKNHKAIGARLKMVFADASVQVVEVASGGGYLSQSTTTPRFSLPQGKRPVRIEVSWPDGNASKHAIPSPLPRSLKLTSPKS